MRLQLRETGSIVVRAPRADVLRMLESRHRDGRAVGADRYEAAGSTYVLRESTDGTRIFHARKESAPVAVSARERDELRRAVQSDLFELRRVFEIASPP